MTRFLMMTAVVLVLAGCEQSINAGNHCGPSTCSGCCQGDKCELGNSAAACGVNGLACAVCASPQVCSASSQCAANGGGIGGGGGSGGGSAGGAGGGAGGGGGGAGGGAGGGGSSPTHYGTISVGHSCRNFGGSVEYCFSGAQAAFYEGVWPCAASVLNGCEVLECYSVSADAGTVFPSVRSAGTITIAGTRADGGIALSFRDGGYGTFAGDARLWDGGETLTVTAQGADVAGFVKTVSAPNEITVTAPVCTMGTSGACGSVSLATDLTISWTGAASTEVKMSSHAAAKSVFVTCPLASSPGTISAAVLARLGKTVAGSGTNSSHSIAVRPISTNTFTIGSYVVRLSADGSGLVGTFVTSD